MSKEIKSAEEILNKHEWMPCGGWTKENMLAAMEEYAAQFKDREVSEEEIDAAFLNFVENAKFYHRDFSKPAFIAGVNFVISALRH